LLIDWFTVVAQIVNFVVLVALLRYFLYGPILRAMDEREESVASLWKEADDKLEQARQEAERKRKAREEMDERREQLLAEAREEAESLRRERRREIREELERTRKQWTETLDEERESFERELRDRVSSGVWQVARRALRDLADADIEERATKVFVGRLREMDDETRERWTSRVQEAGRCVVRSGFELPRGARGEIEQAVRDATGEDVAMEFERGGVDFGVELLANGHRVSWCLDSYLGGLRDEVARALHRRTSAGEDNGAGDRHAEENGDASERTNAEEDEEDQDRERDKEDDSPKSGDGGESDTEASERD
jgi:F-type H+-transporting ATPase subunit b